MAAPRDSSEADRARAVSTLDGWTTSGLPKYSTSVEHTSAAVADRCARSGVEAVKAGVYAGPPPVKTEPALRGCIPVLRRLSPTGETRRSRASSRDQGAPRAWTWVHRDFPERWEDFALAAAGTLSTAMGSPTFSAHAAWVPTAASPGQGRRHGVSTTATRAGQQPHPFLARASDRPSADLGAAPGAGQEVAMMGSLDHVRPGSSCGSGGPSASGDSVAQYPAARRFVQPAAATKFVVLVEDNGPIHGRNSPWQRFEAREH